MKKIAFFCIPAHGHTNPMLPVAAELVRRGDAVRFYSFDEFEAKIKATGAEFVSCTRFLPEMTKEEEEAVKNISTTEMTNLCSFPFFAQKNAGSAEQKEENGERRKENRVEWSHDPEIRLHQITS